jgi:3-hydroxy-9,10-secoandrosta-1,3,5(10)-triene-9,17-dione monooxygenase
VIPLQDLFTRPEDMRDGTPGTRLHGNPMYLGRVAGPYHMSLITPVIGAAKAALDEYQDIIRTKNTNFPPITPRAEHEDFQRAFGQATILTDTAENLMIRGGEVYMEMCQRWASDGTLITVEQNLRLWAMLQHAGRIACDAVELLFKNAGALGGAQRQPNGAVSARRADVSDTPFVAVREFLGTGRPRASRPADPAFLLLARLQVH